MEEFDFSLSSDDVDDQISTQDSLVQQLIFPYAEQAQLPAEEMRYLDEVATEVETMRLKQMGALLPPDTVEGLSLKRLSTWYVITWRDKVLNGERCWLRYVAREYAWLTPERQDLFHAHWH